MDTEAEDVWDYTQNVEPLCLQSLEIRTTADLERFAEIARDAYNGSVYKPHAFKGELMELVDYFKSQIDNAPT